MSSKEGKNTTIQMRATWELRTRLENFAKRKNITTSALIGLWVSERLEEEEKKLGK